MIHLNDVKTSNSTTVSLKNQVTMRKNIQVCQVIDVAPYRQNNAATGAMVRR